MRFEIFDIEEYLRYAFIIGIGTKPDNYLKERIRDQIREAMESLGREPESYSVSIVRNEEEESGESGMEPLRIGRKYLIFALLSSGELDDSLSDRELEEEKRELSKGIFCPQGSWVTLVLLYDATVKMIATEEPVPALL